MALPFCRQAFALSSLPLEPDDKAMPCAGSPTLQICENKKGLHKVVLFIFGDEGSRTPVQNGSKQASTSVDINSLGLFREYQNLLNNPECFFRKH